MNFLKIVEFVDELEKIFPYPEGFDRVEFEVPLLQTLGLSSMHTIAKDYDVHRN